MKKLEAIISDKRLLQYMGNRMGQRDETQLRYADAVQACGSIFYLDKTISEISRLFGHNEECLRNQLKRHFPDLVPERNRLRKELGFVKKARKGAFDSTNEKYAAAVELLRKTKLTIREVAEVTGVGVSGLQQHVLFYHHDLANERLQRRLDRLDKPRELDEISATGRKNEPRAKTREQYAEAVKLYCETDLSISEIARQLDMKRKPLAKYLLRWHRDVAERRKLKK